MDGNGIAEAIYTELEGLGQRPVFFQLDSNVPEGSDVVFLFGPFGKFLHIPQHFAGRQKAGQHFAGRQKAGQHIAGLDRPQRPAFVYWNTEGLPDLHLPWPAVSLASKLRSWLGRMSHSPDPRLRRMAAASFFAAIEPRMLRFRYLGDYLFAQSRGWVDVFADISAVYAGYFRRRGIPAIAAPFGSFPGWYEDLGLERDIDVLWMGKRATSRRSQALDRLRQELQAHGVEILMVDNIEHPFVFGEERTRLLNRTKITLNLLRTWYDENSLRICIAAPNRSLIVSEPLLPHVPQYRDGVHYVSAPLDKLAGTILYYLEHDEERQRIVENAYRLTTTQLTFANSMKTILEACADRTGFQITFPEKIIWKPVRSAGE